MDQANQQIRSADLNDNTSRIVIDINPSDIAVYNQAAGNLRLVFAHPLPSNNETVVDNRKLSVRSK